MRRGKKVQNSSTLYCFSPPVMMATFLIETVGALYVILRYRLATATKLTAAILVCLGLFQLAEWNVCETAFGLSSMAWSKVGYAAITMLPPLGLHLAMVISGEGRKWARTVPYGAAAAFAGTFLVFTNGLTASTCQGNYVIFEINERLNALYTLYYYGLLFAGTLYALIYAHERQGHRKQKKALWWLGIGYLAFIAPTTAVVAIAPTAIHGVPSIMCGFAVLLALILLFRVAPRILTLRDDHAA